MTEQETTVTTTTETDPVTTDKETVTTSQESTFKPPASQEEFDKMLAARIKRAEAKAKDDAKKEFEAEQKRQKDEEAGNWQSVAETEKQKREAAEKLLADRDLADKRRAIAAKHHVPAELADRILGSTDEELESDAKKIAASLKKQGIDTEGGRGGNGSDKGRKNTTENFRFGRPDVVAWPGSQKQE